MKVYRMTKIIVELEYAEAEYLRDLLQNYLGDREDPVDKRELRERIFKGIAAELRII